MQAQNDFLRLDTSLLESILKAYRADYGTLPNPDELMQDKKTITLLQNELTSRKKSDFRTLLEAKKI